MSGDIIVVAASAPPSSIWDDLFAFSGSSYRFAVETPIGDGGVGEGGGGGGGGGDSFIEEFKKLIAALLSKLLDKVIKTEEEIRQAEGRIATRFNPDNVVALSTYTTSGGKQGTMWNMSDGTVFWDTNNNNTPDYQTRFTTDGHLYGDDGNGWQMLN